MPPSPAPIVRRTAHEREGAADSGSWGWCGRGISYEAIARAGESFARAGAANRRDVA